ncbi:hypothetical protein GF359_02130 [candidate division WOR-3 bacterium]|uniref:Outer membrane protein beta-barrel domain-containing protein n=1 Tax=candidate division WOR-3 bacterium TaxID=2052148 RepID=A0A9D5K7W5_UNCW3|nr:hypothetical protein [candidate division WOR-3 bacterium]MBD3363991.1 hypothetical protein [candidate division WOR-3 bacterium]
MKTIRLIILVLIFFALSSCVSPFYGTARIEEGLKIDAGIAGTSYIDGYLGRNPSYTGIRGDVEVGYGICKYFQANARIGLGWGHGGKRYFGNSRNDFIHDIALGPQFALPLSSSWNLTPALRVEAGYANDEFYATPALLLGFGNPETFTIGARFLTYILDQIFVTFHVKRVNIFAGVDIWTQLSPDFSDNPPVATLGAGCKLK